MAGSVSPEVGQIMDLVVAKLVQCPDYAREEARRCVNSVLWGLLRFLEFRMNMTRGNDPGSAYLFADTERIHVKPKSVAKPADASSAKAAPRDYLEKELQLDCHKFLYVALGNSVKLEQSDLAGGRADIYVEKGHARLIIEVKREDRDGSHGALLTAYGAQATDYSNTSIRISFLLVLDRSRPDGTTGYITDKVSVQTVTKHGDSVPRTLVIVVMPGKRKRPSQLTLAG